MDYFQSIVSQWLVSGGRTLIAEKYYLRTSHIGALSARHQKHFWPDILAVRLRDKEVFLCEVTWSSNWPVLRRKVESYRDRMSAIEEALDVWLGIPRGEGWQISVWYFVPRTHAAKLLELAPAGLPFRVTELEEIRPWEYIHGCRAGDDRAIEPL